MDDAIKHDSSLDRFRPLVQEVTGYYFVERYPGFEEGPSKKEVEEAYQQAKSLMDEIRKKSLLSRVFSNN